MSADIGIFGLSTRANNLAVHFALQGLEVAIGNRSSDMIKECTKLAEKKEVDDKITGTKDVTAFCNSLSSPRKVLFLGKAGSTIEKNLSKVVPCLESGDIVVDASSDGFETCVRRAKEMEEKGIRYMTMCMLGSVRDALKGCGFLLSGDRSAYDELEVVLKKAAREDEYESAVAYMGPSVSASYLDTVLCGMVTAEETSLSEAYAMLVAAGFTNEEVGKSMSGWNKEELEGPLVEEAVTVLRKRDEEEGDAYVVDKVVDSARMMGDASALMREMNERHKNVATVAEAVSEGLLEREREVRAKLSETAARPSFDWQKLDHVQLVEDLRNAVICATTMTFIQGFQLLQAASGDYEWSASCEEAARVVAMSSVGRCGAVTLVKEALEENPSNVLASKAVCELLQKKQMSWRRVVALGVVSGVSMPVITSALSSFDWGRREKLPQNLVQAQRDFYASTMFERVDQARGMTYHCRWTEDHN